jgi:hypothetical protein
MKPNHVLTIAAAVFLGLVGSAAIAQPPATRQITIDSGIVGWPGTLVDVPIRIDDAMDVQSVDLVFTFNPAVVQFQSAAAGTLTSPPLVAEEWPINSAYDNVLGVVHFNMYSPGDPIGVGSAGTLTSLKFKVLETANPATDWSNVSIDLVHSIGLSAVSEGDIPFTAQNGSIVAPEPSSLLLLASALIAVPVMLLRRRRAA